jgi:hypothetical protein
VSELSTLAYVEDLCDLTPAELDAACVHARQNSEFIPVSAAILEAHRELTKSARDFLGPRLVEYPEVSQEDREAALEFSKALRKKLCLPDPDKSGGTK